MRFRSILFILAVLLTSAKAYDVTLDAETSSYAFETWTIHAYVGNATHNISYPSCSIDIQMGGETYYSGPMTTYEDMAYFEYEFEGEGSYFVDVDCSGDSNDMSVSVLSNSDVDFDVSSVTGIGDILEMRARYEDKDGLPITVGSCTARVYVHDDYWTSVGLYFDSGSDRYENNLEISRSGEHRIVASCEAYGYSTDSSTEYVTIEASPVSVVPYKTSVSGSYGDRKSVSISVSPSTTTCTTNRGSLVKTYSGEYTLYVDLDFVGSETAIVSCSAPQHSGTSKNILFTSSELDTSVDVGFYPDYPYSFQLFSIVPDFRDSRGRQVTGATCSITLDNSTKTGVSFQGTVFRASAGPSQSTVSVHCSKSGYKSSSATSVFEVQPIDLEGRLEYPDDAKEGEHFSVGVTLRPAVDAECVIDGMLESGVDMKRFKKEGLIKGEGSFDMQINETGTYNFDVSCKSLGYETFVEEGSLKIVILSQSEEVGASILLTILTIILAVAFIMIRRWI